MGFYSAARGCNLQACAYRDHRSQSSNTVHTLSVSADKIQSINARSLTGFVFHSSS